MLDQEVCNYNNIRIVTLSDIIVTMVATVTKWIEKYLNNTKVEWSI